MVEKRENSQRIRRRRVMRGIVLSDKMDKTVVVGVTVLTKDKRYGKYVKRSKKYYAHDKDNSCKEGDLVQIVESRPLSKLKRWRVNAVIQRANV